MVVFLFLGIFCYIWDGVYVGFIVLWVMCNIMFIVFVVYFFIYYIYGVDNDNYGFWLSFIVFMVFCGMV